MVFRFIPEIIFKIQDAVRKKGPHGVRAITNEFARADPEFTGRLDGDTWLACLDAAGVFITTKELERLTKEFDFLYPDFLHLLSNRTMDSAVRRELVARLYAELKEDNGAVAVAAVMERFDAPAHPDVRFNGKSVADCVLHWQLAFEGLPDPMDEEMFAEAFRCIAGSFTNETDAEFVQVFKMCFGIEIPSKGSEDPDLVFRIENMWRAKILHKTERFKSEREALLWGFKYVDPKDIGHISNEQFRQVLERFGLWLPLDECMAVFRRHAEDVGGELRLRYAPFVTKFLADGNPYSTNNPMSDIGTSMRMDYGGPLS